MASNDSFLSQVVSRMRSSEVPLRDQLVVVPTKRAATFLQRELVAQLQDKPATILPRIVTIDGWITEMSGRVILDNTALISILYEVYATYLANQKLGQVETDQMLSLSQTERMLRDFQDMDLALADVEMLLINLENLDDLDSYAYLDEEEREAIKEFWRGLSDQDLDSPQGGYRHFATVWRDIYQLFNVRLAGLKVAYRAGAYRIVAEDTFTSDDLLRALRRYSGSAVSLVNFVGLYNLTPAERAIIKKLQSADADALQVQLYWQRVSIDAEGDFNEHLYNTIDKNAKLLGGVVLDEDFTRKYAPEVHLLSLNSTIQQPQVVNDLIAEITQEDDTALEELRIAIVLNDEKTLIPLMNSLKQPACTSLNVTMGYPLQYTSVATWIRRYLNIYGLVSSSETRVERVKLTCSRLKLWLTAPLTRKLFGDLTTALMDRIALHHYAITASELRTIIEEVAGDADEAVRQRLLDLLTPSLTGVGLLTRIGQLLELLKGLTTATDEETEEATDDDESIDHVILSEALDQIVRYVTQVSNLLQSSEGIHHLLNAPKPVAYLLEQLMAVGSIPFEGAPLEGLQVMGFLETRTLTFDYVIMLNVQEGDLPKSSHTTTLIPDMLRSAFGMTTYRTEDDTNAYHFYRLIQGAKRVYLLQDTRPKSISSMEPSRYVDQIRYLTNLSLDESTYADSLDARNEQEQTVAKTDEEVHRYMKQIASGEKTFSPSDLITYYNCAYQFYLKKIKGIGEPRQEPGVVTQIELGSMVHAYLEWFYKGLKKTSEVSDLEHTVSRDKLQELYKKIVSDKSAPDEILLTDLERYISKAIEIDKRLLQAGHSLQLLASETKMTNLCFEWTDDNGQNHTIHLTGQPDRVDIIDGKDYRIVDYKTGAIKKPKTVEELDTDTLDAWRKMASNCKLGGYILQSCLYAMLYAQQAEQAKEGISKIQPTLYSLAPAIPADEGAISFKETVALDELKKLVTHYLNELVALKFDQTKVLDVCKYCDYKTICGRK